MRALATITSKGQLTVPKSVRDRHDLSRGATVEFREGNGRLWIDTKPVRAVDLIGLLGKPPNGVSLSAQEMDEAIHEAAAAAEDDERIMREWHQGRE